MFQAGVRAAYTASAQAARRMIPDLVFSSLLANGNLADGKPVGRGM